MRLVEAFLLALFTCLGGAALAEPLAGMDGAWTGTGWARQTPQGPQETVRCRLTNRYDAAALTLTVEGRCAVPGRRITLSGHIEGQPGSEAISGRWSDPDGIASTRIHGVQRPGLVAFTFRARDGGTGRNLAQNVVWRLSDDTLHLRSTDRDSPDIVMSEMTFVR